MSGFLSNILPTITGISQLLGGSAYADWRQQLRRASFRGAPFYVESADGDYGRRYVHHEYPGRDLPYAEDLGRKQRTWSFQAYTIGQSFLAERKRVVAACEAAGPGRLVHPLLGSFDAVCTQVTFSDRRDAGGFSALSLSFAEAGQLEKPAATADQPWHLEQSAAGLDSAVQSSFLGNFGLSNVFGGVEAIAGQVTSLADRLDFLRLPAFGIDQGPLGTALNALRHPAIGLLSDSSALFDGISTAFSSFTEATTADRGLLGMLDIAANNPAGMLSSILPFAEPHIEPRSGVLIRAGAAVNTRGTSEQKKQADAVAALRLLEQRLALREIGYIVPGLDLDSNVRAAEVRAELVAAFDLVADDAARVSDDDIYAAVSELQLRVLAMLDSRITSLPALVPYRTPRNLNAITLAWALYSDANRSDELVTRTGAPNPAWLPVEGMVLSE